MDLPIRLHQRLHLNPSEGLRTSCQDLLQSVEVVAVGEYLSEAF